MDFPETETRMASPETQTRKELRAQLESALAWAHQLEQANERLREANTKLDALSSYVSDHYDLSGNFCAGCGDFIDCDTLGTKTCDSCGETEFCHSCVDSSLCPRRCASCDGFVCSDCGDLRTCGDCGYSVCADCLEECEVCSRKRCIECAPTECCDGCDDTLLRCPACLESHMCKARWPRVADPTGDT